MEDNRNKDYDEFFKTPDQKEEDREDVVRKEPDSESTGSEDSYYYSYGPFRPQANHLAETHGSEDEGKSSISETRPVIDVTGHASDPLSHLQAVPVSTERAAEHDRVWQVKQPRKRMWVSSFLAAFLSCALIMTGLVYASDVNNWFTGGPVSAADSTGGDAPVGKTVSVNSGDVGSGAAAALSGSIADIVEQSSPAVVLIETYVSANRGPSSRNNMDFFEYFFGDRIQVQPDNGDNMINSGLGTGFIFDKDGYILTNEHVVGNADEIYVSVEGYTEPFKAELLGADFDLDLAVLKISGDKEFHTLPIGDSGDLRVGEWVTAIGNPLGYDHTVSVGVLSAKGREIQIPEGNRTRNYENLLQTDASINSGNSGGPLLNMQGEVIGINTAVSTDAQGIGFAIPSSTIVSVIDLLKNNQTVPKPYIGVGISNIDESWLEDLKLDNTDGALVTQVEMGSPAAVAGIQTWDVIKKIGDKTIKNVEELQQAVQELGVGARATITIMREGKEIQVGVIVGDRNG